MFPWKLPDLNAKKRRFAISWQIPFRFCHFSRPFYLYKIRLIWPGDNCLWTEFMQNCLRSYKSRFQWSLSPIWKKELMRRRFAFLALKKMDKAKTVFIQRRRLQAHLGKKEENLIATKLACELANELFTQVLLPRQVAAYVFGGMEEVPLRIW